MVDLKALKQQVEKVAKPRKSLWTLAEAVVLANKLERHFAGQFHVALGGSVLHEGFSNKDVDLFVYPHKAYEESILMLEEGLLDCGLRRTTSHKDLKKKWEDVALEAHRAAQQRGYYADEKMVAIWSYKGKRVDILMPWLDDYEEPDLNAFPDDIPY